MCLYILYNPIFIIKSHCNLFLAHAATIDGALVGVAIVGAIVGALIGAVGAVVCMVCYRKKNKV